MRFDAVESLDLTKMVFRAEWIDRGSAGSNPGKSRADFEERPAHPLAGSASMTS
jgi:hypothetical protein